MEKGLVTKPDSLSLIPRIYIKEGLDLHVHALAHINTNIMLQNR